MRFVRACRFSSVVVAAGLLSTSCTAPRASAPNRIATPARQATAVPALRVLAWNVAENAFVRDVAAFRGHLAQARADILLLDEVAPAVAGVPLSDAIAGAPSSRGDTWQIVVGDSGGRQRGVIASRLPLESVPELAGMVPYPPDERQRLQARMVEANQARPVYAMDGGIPVNGAIVQSGARRLLVVVADLQCCGERPDSWQEDRRRVEAREIRQRIGRVLARTTVDALIVGGDLNLVQTPLPLMILTGPYDPPHAGLLAAPLSHLDGQETWTWDGRGTPFPSRPMDFLLYDPRALELREGYVLDSADLSPAEQAQVGLTPDASARMSDHRPLVAAFAWR